MVRVLRPGGWCVLGDLAFLDEQAEKEALAEYDWLEEEYFARIEELRLIFTRLGMGLNARRVTPVTWVLSAASPECTERKPGCWGVGLRTVTERDIR